MARYDGVSPDPLGTGSVLRNITYELYQGKHQIPPSRNAVIKETLLYSYGQRPTPSYSRPGEEFDDAISTRGGEKFGLTQQFTISLPGYRDFRVQIVPCVGTNQFGDSSWQNIIRATAQTVLINDNPGSTEGLACRPPQ